MMNTTAERRLPTRQPYSLFVSQERTVTEMFSMGEEKLGCSEKKKGKPELIQWEST
jgi:hypothetical protein